MSAQWLIDESVSAGEVEGFVDHELKLRRESAGATPRKKPPIAVRINDVVIHDTRKWFGSSNIRLDTLVVHGASEGDKVKDVLHATTLRFPRIKENDRLPIDRPGQGIFYGHPKDFLDVSIMVSRDTADSKELAVAIDSELNSTKARAGAAAVLAATALAPQTALVVGAVGGAAALANVAYNILAKATGNTIGLYRVTYFQKKDAFGIGRHPAADSFRHQDFSFWYEVLLEK